MSGKSVLLAAKTPTTPGMPSASLMSSSAMVAWAMVERTKCTYIVPSAAMSST